MKYTLFLLLIILISPIAQGQRRDSIVMHGTIDTVLVQEKQLNKTKDANAGTRTSKIDVEILNSNRTKSLAELLSENSVVYIKSLGQGALATSSFRGTSSTHTRVNWNGLNINPPMAGSFNFSQIPVFFTDNVELYYGGGNVKNGTGAIGGSINLSNTPVWDNQIHTRAFAEFGSYSTYTGAASVRVGNNHHSLQTRAYYQQSDNDYTYTNKVLTKDPFRETRKEAQYKQAGFMQEAYFKTSDHSILSANMWLQYGNRRLPQPIIVNVTQHEKQEDFDLRGYIGFDYTQGRHKLFIKGAYFLSTLQYDKWLDGNYNYSEDKFNRSVTYHASADYHYNLSQGLNLNTSLNYTRDQIKAANFSSEHTARDVISWQANFRWSATSWLLVNGQFMGEWNDGEFAPTYSIGLFAQLYENILTLKSNAAYNYRFPSLNDLYWQPGGNPNLKPEKGFSYDVTLAYAPRFGEPFSLNIDAALYLMNIDDWIMWLPTKNWFWEPRNVQNVRSYGTEISIKGNYHTDSFSARVNINYNYSPSINRERSFEEDNTYKKQLPYIPKHKANCLLNLEYRKCFLHYQASYTGIRYTMADESYKTNDYTIHNATLGYKLSLYKVNITPQIRVENLFDVYYESTQYYPMPLRNFLASIMFEF